jgi:hypothetical protein
MPRNQKLTKIIAGRTVMVATAEPGGVLVLFDDQSNMKIKTAGPATIPPGGKVKSVHDTVDFPPKMAFSLVDQGYVSNRTNRKAYSFRVAFRTIFWLNS